MYCLLYSYKCFLYFKTLTNFIHYVETLQMYVLNLANIGNLKPGGSSAFKYKHRDNVCATYRAMILGLLNTVC